MKKEHQLVWIGTVIVGILMGALILYGIARSLPFLYDETGRTVVRTITKKILYVILIVLLISTVVRFQSVHRKHRIYCLIGCGALLMYLLLRVLDIHCGFWMDSSILIQSSLAWPHTVFV